MGTFVDDMRRRGFWGSTRMIATRWMDATEEISTHLSVPVGEQVLFVCRLRLADREVIGFERSYFVKAAAKQHPGHYDGGNVRRFKLLRPAC